MGIPSEPDAASDALEAELFEDLFRKYGPVIGGEDLQHLLGFKTLDALRKACDRGTLELPVFMMAGRRSHFALTREVAGMIADARNRVGKPYRRSRAAQSGESKSIAPSSSTPTQELA